MDIIGNGFSETKDVLYSYAEEVEMQIKNFYKRKEIIK